MHKKRVTTGAVNRSLCIVIGIFTLTGILQAVPFAKKFTYTQPDGTQIELRGEGNDFHAVFETVDGYTVVFLPNKKAYHYARLSDDGAGLVSAGLEVGKGDPRELGLQPHLRVPSQALRRQAAARYQAWDRMTQNSKRWQELKRARRDAELPAKAPLVAMSAPAASTGTKVGLTLLIDFDDEPATIPPEEIRNFCNADFYEDYGNNGSVKLYFQYNSKGLLTYSNVVTAYIRIPNSMHPRSYYDDTTESCFRQGNLLVADAVSILTSLPNYQSQIVPTFAPLTLDSEKQILAVNVFFAGSDSGVWAYGLWPHSGALTNVGPKVLTPGGTKIWRYQMVNIGASLELGLFCHENGHLLFGYPDIYDYDGDCHGGAGRFCLMNNGWQGPNPTQICAYLKYVCGWAEITELTSASSLTAVLTASPGPNFNHFYRYQKPGVPTEYFIIENRQAVDRDANLPSSGIAIWHIDELGDHNNQSLAYNTSHENFEVTLVQADNLWDFQNAVNDGDPADLFYLGNSASAYNNQFSDTTSPSARWWDGSASGMFLSNFSASGDTMSFAVVPPILLAVNAQPMANNIFQATITGQPGDSYQVQTSTNLKNWFGYRQVNNVNGQVTFTYTNQLGLGGKFFRAQLVLP